MKKILLILMAIISLVGCAKKEEPKSDDSNKKLSVEELRTTYLDSEFNIPSRIEKDHKLFEKNLKGIKINYSNIKDEDEQIAALAKGEIDIIYGISTPALVRNADKNVKVLSIYGKAPGSFSMYSKDKAIKKATDLIGKKIAGPKGSEYQELLLAYLRKANVDPSSVEFVDLSIEEGFEALQNGSVDASMLNLTKANEAQSMGLNKIVDGKDFIRGVKYVLTTQKYFNEHRDVVDGVIATQEEINKYIIEKDATIKNALLQSMNLTEDVFDSHISKFDFNPEITESDMDGVRRVSDFLYYNGFIKNKVDASSLFINVRG